MRESFFSKFGTLLNRWTVPPTSPDENIIKYWQDRLLFTILLAGCVLGLIVYIPSVALSIKQKLWFVAVADTMIYGWVVVLFFRRSLPFSVRSYSVVCTTYVIGVVLLWTPVSFAAGPVWLFAFPVFAAIFMGIRAALFALAITAVTTISMGFTHDQGILPKGLFNFSEKWLVVTLNFIFLNGIVAISVGFIARGLMISLAQEKSTRGSLERKHGELLDFNRQLEAEMDERRKAEAALKESEERYKALFDRSFELVFLCDFEGNFLDGNDVLLNLIGYSRKEFCSLNFNAFLPEDHRQIVFETLKGIQENGTQRYPVEYRIKPRQGEDLYIETTGTVIHREGKPYAIQGIGRDVTQRKRQEAQRRKLEGQLVQAQKMEAMGTLAGGIAHDFNNILTSILGYTELGLYNVKKGTSLENHLKEVYTAGNRARELVRQILSFARQTDEKPIPMRVSSIVKEALKMLRSAIPATIEIRQDIQSNSLVMANPTQIHQIFMNLCTNAAQAMEDEGGVLMVGLHDEEIEKKFSDKGDGLKPGTYLKIEVADTGKGISEAHLQSIFDPYFTTKEVGEGTGLGLSVVHGIVEKYHGKILVQSKLGQGSVFTIYFVVMKSQKVSHAVESEVLPSGDERILFVDDEVPITKMAEQLLERLGYSVTTQNSSLEALALFRVRSNDFDLVITDMTMPDMTGKKLALELMAIRADIPIILCTGYSRKISEEIAADMGVKALAYKPIKNVALAKIVRNVLDEEKRNVPLTLGRINNE